jgi:hypothetical protein
MYCGGHRPIHNNSQRERERLRLTVRSMVPFLGTKPMGVLSATFSFLILFIIQSNTRQFSPNPGHRNLP